MGTILDYGGDKKSAKQQYLEGIRILQLIEDETGEIHPNKPDFLDNLGIVLADEKLYKEAEKVCREAVKIRSMSRLSEHVELAMSYHNLAFVLTELGEYKDAEKLFLDALRIKEKRLPEKHPSLESSRYLLQYLIQQALANGRAVELSDHPLTQQLLQEIRNN